MFEKLVKPQLPHRHRHRNSSSRLPASNGTPSALPALGMITSHPLYVTSDEFARIAGCRKKGRPKGRE
jgi:hypothetical protein